MTPNKRVLADAAPHGPKTVEDLAIILGLAQPEFLAVLAPGTNLGVLLAVSHVAGIDIAHGQDVTQLVKLLGFLFAHAAHTDTTHAQSIAAARGTHGRRLKQQ